MLTLQDLLRTRTAQPQLNKAIYFNGVNAYIRISDIPQLNNSLESTFIYWVYYVNPSNYDLCGYIKQLGGPAIRLGRDPIGQVFINPGTNTDIHINYYLNPRQWYYLVLTIKCGVSWYVYVNASSIASGTSGLPSQIITGAPWGIGASIELGGYEHYVSGYIPQVLIYSRTPSNSEIQHNMLNPNNPIRDNLVLWFDARACDTSKSICYDLSGNNLHGTMYNVQIVSLPNQVAVGGRL
jgi:hypothetical protein